MTGMEMREIRERLGWSQQRLAQELGMSLSRIVDYERGSTRGVPQHPVVIPKVVELALEALSARVRR
jgi:transcriptional regulator with XRE-family HTH domain